MKFTPQTADEIAEGGMLADGDYDFEVVGACDAISKASGSEMIVLDLKVFTRTGEHRMVKDYLVATPGGMRKVRAFAAAVGMLDDYEAGDLDAHALQGQAGRCKIGADRSEGYEPKNRVAYYLDPAKAQAAVPPVARKTALKPAPQRQVVVAGDIDDDIPF